MSESASSIGAVVHTPVNPDLDMMRQFFNALYPRVEGGFVTFRSIPEPRDARHPKNEHFELDRNFFANVDEFVSKCASASCAAFVLPGTVEAGGTKKKDVLSLPAILVDFDSGKIDANLKAVETLLGPATIIVESGGVTDEGAKKVHAHWRLAKPAAGSEIDTVCQLRLALAERFGGDKSFKQAAQPIRIGGSVHHKRGPVLASVRTVRQEVEYALTDIVAALGDIAPKSAKADNVVNFFDFNKVDMPHSDVERVLTVPIHEGAVDDMTRFQGAGKAIGHFIRMVREGRYDLDGAWEAVKGWNEARMVPPWDEDRLRNDFERLLQADIAEKGPIVAVAAAIETKATGRSVLDWNIKKFAGAAPARRWLVEGLIPLGTTGVFAATGDAGKSMLALQLALSVGAAPPSSSPLDVSAPRFFGQPVVARGAAVILTAEDDSDEVHRRISALDPSGIRENGPAVYVRPMISDGGPRAIIADSATGARPTEFWSELRADLLKVPDLRLVVLDPLSHFAAISLDKDNQAASALMAMLSAFAAESGAAILLVHHMGKSAVPTNLTDARTAIRGASALVDNGRWALTLWEAEDADAAYKVLKPLGQDRRTEQAGVVYFGGLAKGNAPGAKTMRTFVRNAATGLLEDVTMQLIAARPRQAEFDDAAYAALRAWRLEDHTFSFTAGVQGLWKAWQPVFVEAKLRVTRDQVEALFERLLAQKRLVRTLQKRGNYPVYEPALEVE